MGHHQTRNVVWHQCVTSSETAPHLQSHKVRQPHPPTPQQTHTPYSQCTVLYCTCACQKIKSSSKTFFLFELRYFCILVHLLFSDVPFWGTFNWIWLKHNGYNYLVCHDCILDQSHFPLSVGYLIESLKYIFRAIITKGQFPLEWKLLFKVGVVIRGRTTCFRGLVQTLLI